jgi:outer membrane protein OmpA-like peptidoglycan-associated protein
VYAVDGDAKSNTASANVRIVGNPLVDQSLILGTVFDDRNGNGFQDSASLNNVKIKGGFSAAAYIPNSTRIDRGDGAKPEADASAPMLHGLALGTISGRRSEADLAKAHQIVISQVLRSPDFTNDLVVTAANGISLTMNASGQVRTNTSDAIAMPELERRVSQIAEGYLVEYIIRNQGIDEHGIPGVRIATVEGVLVETDAFGRFSLQGVLGGPWNRGRNFIMKVDTVTLPPGSEFTTDNPLVRRITPGIPVRFDFGVKLPSGLMVGAEEAMEVEIGQVFFSNDSAEVRKQYEPVIIKIAEQVRRNPETEVVISATGATPELAYERAKAVREALLAVLTPEESSRLKVSLRESLGSEQELLLSLGLSPKLGSVLFGDDSAVIRPQYETVIATLAGDIEKLITSGKPLVISVEGYADRRGTVSYNESLGLRRAKSVYDAIAIKLSPESRSRIRVEISKPPSAPAATGKVGQK